MTKRTQDDAESRGDAGPLFGYATIDKTRKPIEGTPIVTTVRFDGATISDKHDTARLNAQLRRVRDLVIDGQWHTLREIANATGDPEASISARLRDLRKVKFQAWRVERRRRGDEKRGVHEYRCLP